MLVLLDECIPERLKSELGEHEVRTAREAGLAGKKDGIVVDFACAYFDVLVTISAALPAEQAAARRNLRAVVLEPASYAYAAFAAFAPALRQTLATLAPGQVVRLKA